MTQSHNDTLTASLYMFININIFITSNFCMVFLLFQNLLSSFTSP